MSSITSESLPSLHSVNNPIINLLIIIFFFFKDFKFSYLFIHIK